MAKRKSGAYQTGRTSKAHDKRVRAKGPGKRVSSSKKVYYERRKNRSDMPGSLLGVKLKKIPRKPKAKASTSTLENYVERVKAINKDNNKRISLAKEIKKLTGK